MEPCTRCGRPVADSACRRCQSGEAAQLRPDGGEQSASEEYRKWNPAVNEEWDSAARDAYLERQGCPASPERESVSDEPSPTEPASNGSGTADGDTGSDPARVPPADRPLEDGRAVDHPAQHRLEGEQPQEDTSDWTSELLTRRRLLLGGAGAALAVTGSQLFLSSGPDGGKAVVDEYIRAVADNDWETAGQLYHEETTVRQDIEHRTTIESYKDVLSLRGSLGFMSEIEPEIQRIYEWVSVPDPDEGITDVRFASREVEGMDSWKQFIAIVSIDAETFYEARGRERSVEQVADGKINRGFQISVVRDLTEWSIWEASAPV